MELQKIMTELFNSVKNDNSDKNIKQVIAKAVQLGMKYQENKIKDGIKVVFENLNK